MAAPLLRVLGLDTESKYYIHHYSGIPNIYTNSLITKLKASSVMYTAPSWKGVDFWNMDADALYVEDSLSFDDACFSGGNHFAYYSGFIKLYRVAHGEVSLTTPGLTKKDNHVLSILSNLVRSDIIWLSSVQQDRMASLMKQQFSTKLISQIHEKTVILPPPGFFKTSLPKESQPLRIRKGKELVILWNHRLIASKNFKDFCSILVEFHNKYPDIPFKILFLSSEPEDSFRKAMPTELLGHYDYRGYISDPILYKKVLTEANVAIGTSKLESFGIAVFDAVASGILVLNQDCNDAFVSLVGPTYTFTRKELPDILYKAYSSKEFRSDIHEYNTAGMASIPTKKKSCKILAARLQELKDIKMSEAPKLTSSKILGKAITLIESRTVSKKDLYKEIGWMTGSQPINDHWAGYYYALRREGVNVTEVGGKVYYHLSDTPDIHLPKDPSRPTLF